MTPPRARRILPVLKSNFKEQTMRKLLALMIAVAVVFPLTLAALSLIAVSPWALDRKFYEQLLDDPRLYEVLLQEDLPNTLNQRSPVAAADMIPAGALSTALRTVVTAEDLRAQSLRLVGRVFDAVEGRTTDFELYLDTTQIKQTLQTPTGAEKFARALATSLPACAAGQNAVAAGSVLMRCVPSDQSANQAAAAIAAALPEFLSTVPDRIDVQRENTEGAHWTRGTPVMFAAANSLNFAIVIMLGLAAGAWLVTALIAAESQRERLLWLGWMLIVPAALILLLGVSINAPFTTGWIRFGLNEARFGGMEYSLAFREALLGSIGPALRTIANGFLTAGAAAGAIGLGLIVWGGYTPNERKAAAVVARDA
jgi:hypothetical protein